MKKLKVLNLYAGIGGNRKLWQDVEVTAVELDPAIAKIYQDYFPEDKVIVGDAHQYLLDHYKSFDFIWSSPPCPSHSQTNHFLNAQGVVRYPDMKLYEEIIFLDTFFKGKYSVENVKPYYEPLIKAHQIERHLFWCNFKLGDHSNGKRISVTNAKGETRRKWADHIKELQDYHGINLNKHKQIGKYGHYKLLANCVHPDTGLYILNCARNIITKSNVNQIDIFEG